MEAAERIKVVARQFALGHHRDMVA